MKKVDKKIDHNKSNELGISRYETLLVIFITFEGVFLPKSLFTCYRFFLSTFSCNFRPRRESATVFARHNAAGWVEGHLGAAYFGSETTRW